MERSFDRDLLDNIPLEFDKDAWIADKKNILLHTGDDILLFQREKPGLYQGHYFLKARGKDAIRLSKEALSIFFTVYPVKVLFGLVPENNKGSYWMSRHLGFRNQGNVDTEIGSCTLFTMTKEEFDERSN